MSEKIYELEKIIGKERIIKNPKLLKFFSSDLSCFDPVKMPSYLVKPRNARDVQDIVIFSNKYEVPLTASSSTIHFYGRTIPAEGGIIIDLSEMNRIIRIDNRNKNATIEPGVTFSQIGIIKEKGLMPLTPLYPPSEKSVITSYLEREPLLIPKLEYYEPILTMEIVLASGEILRTGSAAVMPSKFADYVVPFGPGLNWNQIFQGAQGTLGIVTSATIKIEYLPKHEKFYFLNSNDLENLINPLYEIQRYLLGHECLILNNLNLAMILASDNSEIEKIRAKLPHWTLITCLSGGILFPEEKLKQEEEDFIECLHEFNIESALTLSGFENRIPQIFRQSYNNKYWKIKLKDNFQDTFFITTFDKIPDFIKKVNEMLYEHGFPLENVGYYIQPLARGGACHVEFTVFYNLSDNKKHQSIKKMYEKIIESLFEMGAYFSRPYGNFLSNIVYKKNLVYFHVLRKLKKIFDPNNIMNPEKFCFLEGDEDFA